MFKEPSIDDVFVYGTREYSRMDLLGSYLEGHIKRFRATGTVEDVGVYCHPPMFSAPTMKEIMSALKDGSLTEWMKKQEWIPPVEEAFEDFFEKKLYEEKLRLIDDQLDHEGK
jgi:hypothetical protein